ncbi:MAG: SurA N-terminal domain-containing protein [Sphingomonadaceae bacterium]
MLNSFRNFFKSRFGIIVTLAFLVIIGIAFASSDVANTGTFGGVAGGDNVAVVGDRKIGNADLSRAVTARVDQLRQDDSTLSMSSFIAQGGLDAVLDSMIDRYAMAEYAQEHGLRAGDNLVNSEILQIQAFHGPDGKFDQKTYQQVISSRGLTDAMVRADFADGLLSQQVLFPASYGATVPDKFITNYASLLKERREGAIGLIMSSAYAPEGKPTDAQVQAYYDANRSDFIRPDRRVIRYAVFDDSAVSDRIDPTEAEIAAQYKTDSAKYAAREERSYTQLIVPTQQAAQAIENGIKAGGSMEAAARQAGLQTSKVGPVTKTAVAETSSPAVANAVFSTGAGQLAPPVRSGLGWHVIRVDKVQTTPARGLAQVRGEIADTLRAQNRRKAFSDLAVNIEDQINDGVALSDLAGQLGAKIETSPLLTADGRVYGNPGAQTPATLAPVLATAFQMEEEGEPQLAPSPDANSFIVFEASRIIPSATAPLKEIRPDVEAAWAQAEGAKRAKAAADKVLARVSKGDSLQDAMRAENVTPPQIERINLSREQLMASGQQVPPPLALLFSMAQGTAKKLEGPNEMGWFIVDLDKIEAGTIAKTEPLFAQARTELGGAVGNEYAEQLQNAIIKSMNVKRNKSALAAVRKQLTGEN